ncbi:MAG: UDP-hydrolyzing UDP-N-acetyl-D-glucosamine 2-epimerase [Enterobacterales bacterium]|jgi:UDP-hydrolysing UDP-N-acetyl-D-glucosamine 2-epimerase
MKKRRIAIVINSRANYGRIKSVLTEIKKLPGLELMIVVGASALLYRFGNVKDIIEKDGFEITTAVYSIVEGETPTTMAKSTGLAIMELATIFENLKPDIVLTVADRFETIATAIAASYMNIPVAHTQGGEVTGSIDESVRHAVTKLSHIHFPATKKSADILIKMGELPETVHYTGCPAIDMIADLDLKLPNDFFEKYLGVGEKIDPAKPYIVVLQHPVTTEYGQGLSQINETLTAVGAIDMQTVWLWPNVDAGSDDISKGLRQYRELNTKSKIHFYRNFSVEDYARLISNSSCLIGNSSSAIREGAFLGVPGVNIGTRQQGREKASNIVNVDYNAIEIQRAISSQINHEKYERSTLFGDGKAGERIAKILSTTEVSVQKRLSYTD